MCLEVSGLVLFEPFGSEINAEAIGSLSALNLNHSIPKIVF